MRILTINTGSSSLKSALYGEAEKCLLSCEVRRIGISAGSITISDPNGIIVNNDDRFVTHGAALKAFLDWLGKERRAQEIGAVGHRVVHGGPWLQRSAGC
jgi:acetate kinase